MQLQSIEISPCSATKTICHGNRASEIFSAQCFVVKGAYNKPLDFLDHTQFRDLL